MKNKLFKIFSIVFAITIMLTFCSCKSNPVLISSSYTPAVKEYNISPLNYHALYCTDNMATTEIAVSDEKIYCKWLDDNDQEHISVIENIYSQTKEWVNIVDKEEIDVALKYFKTYNYQPLKENVGECIVYTDKNNDFYIADIDADITYNLNINLKDWRRFATNNTDTFAFLSAQPLHTDSETLFELRVYKIDKYLSGSTIHNTTLLRNMTASDDLNNIDSIIILDETCIAKPYPTDKDSIEFLQKYTYSHYRSTKKEYADQLLKDKTEFSLEVITKSKSKYYLYLMQDGSIAITQMCGDSEVPDIAYDFYTADEDDILTKEKLENF